jgi:hypothetical protein
LQRNSAAQQTIKTERLYLSILTVFQSSTFCIYDTVNWDEYICSIYQMSNERTSTRHQTSQIQVLYHHLSLFFLQSVLHFHALNPDIQL